MREGTTPQTRMPCATCPWRKSTPTGGFPGGIIDTDALVRMVRGVSNRIMQCHSTRDNDPKVCVGFVVQVGHESVACRLAVIVGLFDPAGMSVDEELHSLESLLLTHGGRRAQ